MNSIELARKLGAALQQEPEYIRYQIAKQQNDEDQELQELMQAFEVQRMKLNAEMSKDDRDEEKIRELNKGLRDLYMQLMRNENMAEYQDAKAAMDDRVKYINSIISLCVAGEDPETCEPAATGCGSGGCGGCKGCS